MLPATTQLSMMPQPWRPRLLLIMTILVHVSVLLVVLSLPALLPYGLALLLLNHIILAVLGLTPRSVWMGSNLTSLPASAIARREIVLTFDDGPDPLVTPQVLDILDQYQARASFFCIGRQATRYPDLCREIVRRGHTVENHSQTHRHNFALLGPRAYLREIRLAQSTLEQVSGSRPCFFRAPAGFRNLFLDAVLRSLKLQLVSWSVRGFDTRVRDPERVRQKMIRALHPGAILLLHDGNAARSSTHVPMVLEVLPSLLQAAKTAGLRCISLQEACLPVAVTRPAAARESNSITSAWNVRLQAGSQQEQISPVPLE